MSSKPKRDKLKAVIVTTDLIEFEAGNKAMAMRVHLSNVRHDRIVGNKQAKVYQQLLTLPLEGEEVTLEAIDKFGKDLMRLLNLGLAGKPWTKEVQKSFRKPTPESDLKLIEKP